MGTAAFAAIAARLILRYAAGFFVAKGLLAPDVGPELANDVDLQAMIEVGIGLILTAAAEVWFYVAKRMGWAT